MTATTPDSFSGWNKDINPSTRISSGDLAIGINANGDIASMRLNDLQISQYEPSTHDVGISGLWLRHHVGGHNGGERIEYTPLLGNGSQVRYGEGSATWDGEAFGVVWTVRLNVERDDERDENTRTGEPDAELGHFADAVWTWHVDVRPRSQGPVDDGKADGDVDSRTGVQKKDGTFDNAEHPHDSYGTWDLVVAQDIALAPTQQAMSSEPYISQYVAYHADRFPDVGFVLAARQTMACAPKFPLFTTSIVQGARAYLTDGFDFYGRAARRGDAPAALNSPNWDGCHINQYEFGMACLLSDERELASGLSWSVVNTVSADYRGELADACQKAALQAAHIAIPVSVSSAVRASEPVSLLATASELNGEPLDEDEFLEVGAGPAIGVERDSSGKSLSYFSARASHIVSGTKETIVDRSHGQILLANGTLDPDTAVFAATTYAPGVFASHIVLGNTNLHRVVTVQHNALNLLHSQGIRILVRRSGAHSEWQLLGVPSAYVMDLGGSKWIYRIAGETITVSTTASTRENAIDIMLSATTELDIIATIDIESATQWQLDTFGIMPENKPASGSGAQSMPLAGKPAEAADTNGVRDWEGGILSADTDSPISSYYPGLRYLFASNTATFGDDAVLFNGTPHGTGLLTFTAGQTSSLHIVVAGSLEGSQAVQDVVARDMADDLLPNATIENWRTRRETELDRHYRNIIDFMDQLHIDGEGRIGEFNLSLPWFVQNALVHFLSPHGLEQYSGAAWGTRDVCQGPFELALSFGHFNMARTIALKVFAHQNADGSLPQWFMFDKYTNLYQHDSHGDIPVWPLMVIGEYLEATGDDSILDETVGFWNPETDTVCESGAKVGDHLIRTMDYIRSHRVPGTDLFSYGEGDWDDTLQPAQESMKQNMASTWTVALLYQAAHLLGTELSKAGRDKASKPLLKEAATIKREFADNFIFNGILAGYVLFDDGKPIPIIHPDDTRTGIQYRLIPMNRTMISGLLSDDGVRHHEALLNDNLHYPDGVRLMNRPTAFHDGVTSVFKRGEQSANVGREIGLMYTHAHIRYTEALGLLGRSTLGAELLRVSPVGQFERLATSEPRQRNCYFASSDADFPDRYTADEQWDRLKAGAKQPVGVRGGWRVYSSGPGIYIRQTVQHLLGIQVYADEVVFDPVLDREDDGLTIEFALFGVLRVIRYHVVEGNVPVGVRVATNKDNADARDIDGEFAELPYRCGGLRVKSADLGEAAVIDITVSADRARIH
jgi:CRISPR-associated protein Csx3